MCRKLILLISFVLVFALCNGIWAADVIWDGGGGNNLWNTAANWDDDSVPGSDDRAIIDFEELNSLVIDCNVIVDGTTTVGELSGPLADSNGYSVLDINDVTFNIKGQWDWCHTDNDFTRPGTGVINITGESIVTVDGQLRGISAKKATSIFNLSDDAKFIVYDIMRQVDGDANTTAIYNVSGDAVWELYGDDDGWSMRMCDHGYTVFNLSDNAFIDVDGYFRGGDNDDAYFVVNMYGGVMKMGTGGDDDEESIVLGDDGSGEFNFYGGVLRGDGRINIRNRQDDSNTVFLVDGGTGYFGGDMLLNTGGGDGATVHVKINSGALGCGGILRLPDDGSANADVTMYGGTLAAGGGMEHGSDDWFIKMYGGALYLGGDNIADINEGMDANKITFPDPTKVVHLEYLSGEDLTILAVYDANLAWGFRPYDGKVDVDSGVIKWFSGASTQDVNGHDVYVAFNDKQAVEDANRNTVGVYRGSQDRDDIDYDIGIISPGTTIYWRIDEANGLDVYKGPVLVFSTESGETTNPFPANGDYEAAISPKGTLRWDKGGSWVTSSEVYFGTNKDAVTDANKNTTGIYQGATPGASYDMGELELEGPKYYWRVDQRGGAFYVKGKVWSFQLTNYFLIDDFETYADTAKLIAVWPDGGTNGSGAELTLLIDDDDNEYAQSGVQCMKFWFDNKDWSNSHTERTFSPTWDFTVSGTTAMALYFSGDSTNRSNRVETMSVTLTDSTPTSDSVDYDGDPCNILIDEWFRWDIALSAFSGVDSNNVAKMKIAFADEQNGYGIVYFDDFRLYQPRCLPEKTGLLADITGDCIVDSDELEGIGDDWLMAGLGTVNAEAPTVGPVVYYAFDNTSGTQITDDSGNDYHGTFFEDMNQTPADITDRVDSDAKAGKSLHLCNPDENPALGYGAVLIPAEAWTDNSFTDEISFSMWIKNVHTDEEPDGGAVMFEFREWDGVSDEGDDTVIGVGTDDENDTFEFQDDDEDTSVEQVWAELTEWTHYAFIRDADDLSIFVNGLRKVRGGSSGNEMNEPGLLYLGMSCDRAPGNTGDLHDGFTGNIDEFKMFNYALSYANVVSLAGVGSVWDEVDSDYDLIDDNKINFLDYTVIGDEWLIGPILWP